MNDILVRGGRHLALSAAMAALLAPLSGNAIPANKSSDLGGYAGTLNFEPTNGHVLLENPVVLEAFDKANVPASVRREIGDYEIGGLIEDRQGILVSRGCREHFCSEFHYGLYVNSRTGMTALCHFSRKATWYVPGTGKPEVSSAPCPEQIESAPASIRVALKGHDAPAVAAERGSGRIWGAFSFPADFIPEDIEACAENIASGGLMCARQSLVQGPSVFYSLDVPPGNYRVFARTSESPGKKAYYSQAIICGGGTGGEAHCKDHAPVVLNVTAGSVHSDINPQDWYAP